MTRFRKRAVTKPTFRDDLDCVLQLAEDELEHLRQDAKYDKDCAADYRESKGALERVVRGFETAHMVISERKV